jgi:hypothetical protein
MKEVTMGYWENTTYVNSSDPRQVMAGLESRFIREAMRRVPAPAKRERFSYEPMQYATALENDLWGVAVFPGAASWTIVKTAPLELLGEQAADAPRRRLADICAELSAAAFQVNVYDGSATLLCEVSDTGETFISGFSGANDPMQWHGQDLEEEFLQARFRYFPHQEVVGAGTYGDDFAQTLSAAFGGSNAEHCDNGTSVGTLISHDHPPISGGEFAYFQWCGKSRVLIPPCSWEHWGEHGK